MIRKIIPFVVRLLITLAAFWLIFRSINLGSIKETLAHTDRGYLALAVALYFLVQFGCVLRWKLLAPAHPSLTYSFLTNSYFVAAFFNTFLPTTIGGDVIRGYDLIKATGQWKESLASIVLDRMVGMLSLLVLAVGAWLVFPLAQQDPVIRGSFLGFCAVAILAFILLGSRRMLTASFKPFAKIGLGQLQSHAKQFQETLLSYLKKPKVLLSAFSLSVALQIIAMILFGFLAKALGLDIPLAFIFLALPIISAVSQLPISLNGWGVREGVTILLLARVGVDSTKAISLSLLGAFIPLLGAAVGGVVFLLRRRKKRPAAAA